jgi:hypothetical protein
MWRIGWAPNSIPIYIQQDETLHSIFISGYCSTCFGWYIHPSSGAQPAASTASGICHTVTAICRYRGRVGTGVRHPQHTQIGSNSSTIAADSSNGVTNTRCCRCSCMRSWWWVDVPPETCRVVSRYIYINCVTLHPVEYILEYTYNARNHIYVKSPNNTNKLKTGFNSAFKELVL